MKWASHGHAFCTTHLYFKFLGVHTLQPVDLKTKGKTAMFLFTSICFCKGQRSHEAVLFLNNINSSEHFVYEQGI